MRISKAESFWPVSVFFLLQVTLIFILAFCPGTVAGAQLVATVTYRNNSINEIKNIRHRVTIPPDTLYQKITGIAVDKIEDFEILNHKNSTDKYIAFAFDLAPTSSVVMNISFTVKKMLDSFAYKDISRVDFNEFLDEYLLPSKNIESDSMKIKAIARNIAETNVALAKQLEAAYAFPDDNLQFRPQRPTSALKALNSGYGDCTEYAYVFVALSRNLGIPARVISGFYFGKKRRFSKPNHNEAEIFLKGTGWVPVFPNLGNSRYSDEYGLGKIPDTFIVLKRSDVWTWANTLPKKPAGVGKKLEIEMVWEIID